MAEPAYLGTVGHELASDEARAGFRFVLRLGLALHRYGTPAHRIEEVMVVVSRGLGLEGRFVSTPTSISASFGPPEELRATLIRADPGEVDLSRLAALDALVTELVARELPLGAASKRLEAILAAPSRYGPITIAVFYGICALFGAQLFGGGLAEMGVSAVLGLFVGVLAVLSGRFPALARVLEVTAAFGASALAVAGTRLFGPYSAGIVTLSALIFLLPGLTLSVAMTEVATRNLISGASRLTGATLVFLQLGFGVALGQKVSLLLPPGPAAAPVVPLPAWVYPITLVMVVLSLAILFKARLRDTGFCLIAGGLAYAGARLSSHGLGPELGAFVGALVLASFANLYARILDRPALVLTVPGIMLLVPGSLGYRSLESLLADDVVAGLGSAFSAVVVLVALSGGILIANSLVPPRRLL